MSTSNKWSLWQFFKNTPASSFLLKKQPKRRHPKKSKSPLKRGHLVTLVCGIHRLSTRYSGSYTLSFMNYHYNLIHYFSKFTIIAAAEGIITINFKAPSESSACQLRMPVHLNRHRVLGNVDYFSMCGSVVFSDLSLGNKRISSGSVISLKLFS